MHLSTVGWRWFDGRLGNLEARYRKTAYRVAELRTALMLLRHMHAGTVGSPPPTEATAPTEARTQMAEASSSPAPKSAVMEASSNSEDAVRGPADGDAAQQPRRASVKPTDTAGQGGEGPSQHSAEGASEGASEGISQSKAAESKAVPAADTYSPDAAAQPPSAGPPPGVPFLRLSHSHDAATFLRGRLDLSRVIVMGHSFGGATAAAFAAERAVEVSCCVALDPWWPAIPPDHPLLSEAGGGERRGLPCPLTYAGLCVGRHRLLSIIHNTC